MSLPVFPAPGAIPPTTFYNLQGLAGWLNQNPTYKGYFINFPNLFPYLYSMTNNNLPQGYNVQNVPLAPAVTNLSYQQLFQYQQQLATFRRVYDYNYNQYLNFLNTGQAPVYYRFNSYQEQMDHKTALGFINQLYPFQAMAMGTNDAGTTLGWTIPFPL